MLNKKKNNKGFTLVELLVVIAIIGVLAVVAVPALFKNIEKGKIASLEADISAIRSASLSYYADKAAYPELAEATSDVNEIITAFGNELEGIRNPYDAKFNLTGTTVGGDLKLIITIPPDKSISADGTTKLEKELTGIGTISGNIITVTLIKGASAGN